VNSVENRILSR